MVSLMQWLDGCHLMLLLLLAAAAMLLAARGRMGGLQHRLQARRASCWRRRGWPPSLWPCWPSEYTCLSRPSLCRG